MSKINELDRRSSGKIASISGSTVTKLSKFYRIPCSCFALLTIVTLPAYGQVVNLNFPPIATGYDQEIDATVQARPHTLYAPLGIRFRAFEIYPSADQLFGYNSNPTGSSTAHGSAFSRTAVSVSANSDWSRNSLGGEIGLDEYDYFSIASAHYTDWHAGLQTGYTIAGEQLTLAYSHQSYHQLGSAIGRVSSATPVSDNTDTAQMQYPLDLGRFGVTPDGSVSVYRYGSATVDGTRLDQKYLDRAVYAGGMTGRYTMAGFGSLLVVARATDAVYPHRFAGLPTNNSRNFMLLAGADYHADGPWRYRLLVGGEVSTFSAAEYSTRASPTVEGNVTWTPTPLTTVVGTISRAVNDPLAAGVSGDTLNSANLQVDREVLRNLVLEGRGGFQYAQYFAGGGTQSSYTFGGSISYLASRVLHISLDVDYVDQSSANGASRSVRTIGSQLTGSTQLIAGVTLHVAL